MTAPPRWFYPTLAACAVAVTASIVYALVIAPTQWVPMSAGARVNTRTGEWCLTSVASASGGATTGSDGQVIYGASTYRTQCYLPTVAPDAGER